MTAVAHAAARARAPDRTGIDSRKLAIWTFIGSECLFFASLISTYLVYKGKSLVGPLPHTSRGPIRPTGAGTASRSSRSRWSPSAPRCCCSARFFVVLALYGAQRGNRKMLVGLARRHHALRACSSSACRCTSSPTSSTRDYATATNLFGASFFTLTGFHGTHVTIGVIWLITCSILPSRGKMPPEKALNLEIAALYWHFVDVVWIVIFPVVYLMR